ncbi:transmembrane protein 223 [Solenopsis invicta]|uniref:transmembrane protein 223 n=1 Tax=Solenopsis invicta TaxID=13686 RepID=UPI00193CB239|nr:transmembrane protein 223 [Solenopsis invicta]XP_039312636.1 transmembrane protein 223 [Solenopsis invicta]
MLSLVLKHAITPTTLLTQVRSVHGIIQKYFVHDKNIFSTATAIRTFLSRRARLSNRATQPISALKSNGLGNNLLVRRQMSQLDINTNILNNVLLYKYERKAYFRNMKLFGIGQMFGWSILAFYTYKPSFWDIFTTDIKFKEYLFNHMFRLSMFVFSIFAGPLVFLAIYAACARSIKYIILNKGGKTLSIVTYHLQKKKSTFTVPIGMAKCTSSRQSPGVLPVKVQNTSFYYLVDKQGTFINPQLFDHAFG